MSLSAHFSNFSVHAFFSLNAALMCSMQLLYSSFNKTELNVQIFLLFSLCFENQFVSFSSFSFSLVFQFAHLKYAFCTCRVIYTVQSAAKNCLA